MRTTVELPDDLLRQIEARPALRGRPVQELLAEGMKLLLQASPALKPMSERKKGSAGEWARQFAGIAQLAPGETTDDVRMEYYRKKYGV